MEAFCRLFCCGSGSSSQPAIRETNTEPEKPASREALEPAPKPSAEQPKPAVDTNQGPPVKEWHDNKGMVIKVDGHDHPSHGGTGR